MEVSLLNRPEAGYENPGITVIAPANTGTEAAKTQNAAVRFTDSQDTVPKEDRSQVKVSREELSAVSEVLNKFMSSLNADLQFVVHDKTKQLMVQLVDEKQQKVLKEFPPHEFLDTIAKIRDYVGVLLDRKV